MNQLELSPYDVITSNLTVFCDPKVIAFWNNTLRYDSEQLPFLNKLAFYLGTVSHDDEVRKTKVCLIILRVAETLRKICEETDVPKLYELLEAALMAEFGPSLSIVHTLPACLRQLEIANIVDGYNTLRATATVWGFFLTGPYRGILTRIREHYTDPKDCESLIWYLSTVSSFLCQKVDKRSGNTFVPRLFVGCLEILKGDTPTVVTTEPRTETVMEYASLFMAFESFMYSREMTSLQWKAYCRLRLPWSLFQRFKSFCEPAPMRERTTRVLRCNASAYASDPSLNYSVKINDELPPVLVPVESIRSPLKRCNALTSEEWEEEIGDRPRPAKLRRDETVDLDDLVLDEPPIPYEEEFIEIRDESSDLPVPVEVQPHTVSDCRSACSGDFFDDSHVVHNHVYRKVGKQSKLWILIKGDDEEETNRACAVIDDLMCALKNEARRDYLKVAHNNIYVPNFKD